MAVSIDYSPLEQAQKRLDVLGKNIANVNTSGYKKFSFSDDLKSAGAIQDFSQGSVTSTNKQLDIAITGDGLFRMEKNGVVTYSRNGQFSLSKENYIIDGFGGYLTGYGLDSNGYIDESSLVPLIISKAESKPVATTTASLNITLDSRVSAILSAVPAEPGSVKNTYSVKTFDANDPASFNYSTFVTAYDSLGASHTLQTYFVKRETYYTAAEATAANKVAGDVKESWWDMYATYDNKNLAVDNTGKAIRIQKLTFSTSGTIDKFTNDNYGIDLTLPNNAKINISMAGTQQRGSSFSADTTQNGLSSAALTGYSVDQDGFINATYDNGTTAKMAQVVLAKFNNFQGLKQEANNQWSESPESGAAQIGKAGDPKFGILQGGALESSNVDLTVEMVKLISAQRAFQSAAEVLKKQDEIMQNINNISR